MSEELFDEADRILIATVDTAIEVGLGRTFETDAHTLRVLELGELWVRLEVMMHGIPTGEVLVLPKDIRRIATATALYRKRLETERADA